MQTEFKVIDRCRCCDGQKLIKYLDLGSQPLANNYNKLEDLFVDDVLYGSAQKEYPLNVYYCEDCHHSQLGVVVNPEIMFSNYLYVSGTTETFKQHCKDLAKEAVLKSGKEFIHVLDIACNDGTLLEQFRALGAEICGVDPAKNLRQITYEKKIPVIVDFWNDYSSQAINRRFDIITGTNVFAHVDDIYGFLNNCKRVLSFDGIVVLEFPYCTEMIENNEFDTIYHEHLSYFLVSSFLALSKRAGFNIIDIVTTDIHGGSIRFYLSLVREPFHEKIIYWLADEKQKGLYQWDTYLKFRDRVRNNKKNFIQLLDFLKRNHNTVIGYGASAKGNTMLNYFGARLDYIVDDNQMKWGYLTPGKDIEIRPPAALLDEEIPIYIVIMSWNFSDEIISKVKEIRGEFDDKFVFYVPEVRAG